MTYLTINWDRNELNGLEPEPGSLGELFAWDERKNARVRRLMNLRNGFEPDATKDVSECEYIINAGTTELCLGRVRLEIYRWYRAFVQRLNRGQPAQGICLNDQRFEDELRAYMVTHTGMSLRFIIDLYWLQELSPYARAWLDDKMAWPASNSRRESQYFSQMALLFFEGRASPSAARFGKLFEETMRRLERKNGWFLPDLVLKEDMEYAIRQFSLRTEL
jgi:hypothetical protein